MSFVYNVDSSPYSTYTDGEWTVRKWEDGTLECWCLHHFTKGYIEGQSSATNFEHWGTLYVCRLGRVNYPVTFISAPVCAYSLDGNDSGVGMIDIVTSGNTSQTPLVGFVRPVDTLLSQAGCTVGFHAIGRWK